MNKMSYVSYGFLVSFLATLFWTSFFQPSVWIWVTCAIMLVIGLVLGIFLRTQRTLGLVLCSIGLGTLVASLTALRMVHVTSPNDIEIFANDASATLHGWVTDAPDLRPTQTKLTVTVDTIRVEGVTHDIHGKVLATDYDGWPPIRYGDEVEVSGKLQRPGVIDTFDYARYLELSGIRAVVPRATVRTVQTGAPKPPHARTYAPISWLYRWREAVENRIGLVLPEPHASLLAGLLTGTRRGLPQDLSDDFRTAGITHIVAVSGYNVTIILVLLSGLLFWLPVRKRFWPLVFAAAGFVGFVGGGAPVLRAGIMGVLGLIALRNERVVVPRLTVLWTAFFMLLWNPLMLRYDASFQLSFLAVIGIMELNAPLKKIFSRVPETFAIRESLVVTVAAQLGTLPISLLLFGQLSLVSPIANIIVAPLIPLAMFTGSIATALSVLWMPLGLVIGYIAWALLQLILWTAQICAALPLASVTW